MTAAAASTARIASGSSGITDSSAGIGGSITDSSAGIGGGVNSSRRSVRSGIGRIGRSLFLLRTAGAQHEGNRNGAPDLCIHRQLPQFIQ